MAIFMKFGNVNGEVTASGHKQWIEIASVQWGVGRGVSAGVGGGSKREASAPSVSELVVTKTLDVSSPLLLKEALGGKGETVKIEMTRTDAKAAHTAYQKYILSGALISGYSISSGGDRPSESISLNFTKIDSEYINIDDKQGAKTTGHVIFDVAESKLG